MSRFPAPLDDFEADDFDIPTFEAPQRRASRPATNQNRAQSAPRRSTARGTNSGSNSHSNAGSRLAPPRDDFDAPRPRPSTLSQNRATSTSGASSNRPRSGSKTASKPASRRQSAPNSRASTNFKAPRALRGVHFQSGGVLLLALGGLLAYNARQITPDGALPQLILTALRHLFGIGALILPVGMMILGLMLLVKRQHLNLRAFWRGAGIAFFTLLTASHLMVPRGLEFSDANVLSEHGGMVGGALAYLLRRGLGEVGAIVALGAFALISLLLWSEHTLGELGRVWGDKIGALVAQICEKFAAEKQEMQLRREEKQAEREQAAGDWDDEATENWDESGDYEVEDAPQSGRILPPEIARDAQKARTRRPSPFMTLEDVVGEAQDIEAANGTKSNAAFPDAATPAIDPDSPLDAPQFIAPQTPAKAVEKTPDFPKIEMLDAPPPPSVVDFGSSDEEAELTPIESLEKQAEESATGGDVETKRPKTDLPRRSFGDGPLMPTYFDPAVRALDPPVPPDNAGAEEEIQKGVLGVQETLAAFKIDARVTDVKRVLVI